MKYWVRVLSVMLVAASVYGFQSAEKEKNNKDVSDWNGVYKGSQTTDGKEVIFVLYLKNDFTYVLKSMEKGDSVVVESNGNLSWNKAGNEVTIESSENKQKIVYKRNGNVLEKMKANKKAVESETYQLHRINLQEITDKYWQLIEVDGNAANGTYMKEPYLVVVKEGDRIYGSSECNTFNGRYNIAETNQIRFYKIASSMAACLDMKLETKLFQSLQSADNYEISEDGEYLSLNKAKSTLARFEVNYFK